LTAYEILQIDAEKPELMFERDVEKIKKLYRRMALAWHPNFCHDPRAGDVMHHLTELRDKAHEKLTKGIWQEPGYFSCTLTDGKLFRVRADASRSFELGTTYTNGPKN
jgi:hypothetical protein